MSNIFVEVIVDIKNSNVNKSFYYRIPEEYKDIENFLGYRVEVTFGTRVIQGYIINQVESVDFDSSKIKYIKKLKDKTPLLTKELIELSKVMADELYSSEIQVIEAMLPTIFKNKYVEYYKLLEEDSIKEEYIKYFSSKKIIEKKKLDASLPSEEIKELISNSIIKLISLAKEQIQNKTVKVYTLKDIAYKEKLTKKQEILYLYLQKNKNIKKEELKDILDIGPSVAKKMLELGVIEEVSIDEEKENSIKKYNNPIILNEYQEDVYKKIKSSFELDESSDFLLHGVTGSGKTEIYIKLVEECIRLGKDAIVLVPEIILTPQIEKKFRTVFGENVAIIHSRLSKKEKYEEWKKIRDGEVQICLGTRSSIFAPFENLGLIIIDEEHESSYKQQENPRYDTKDIAKKRVTYNRATVVFASATPSVDLYYEFSNNKKDKLLKILKRYNDSMPDIEIVALDSKEDILSNKLIEEIEDRISKKEQILLFLNKRGYTNFIRCFTCGYIYNCENCDISLNYHKKDNSLHCHLCGYRKKVSNIEKCCENPELVSGAFGIQKIEEYIKSRIDNVRIIRMDSDTTSTKGSYDRLLTDFREKKADILLGTQMISKGLDFPDITLVGVLSIDNIVAFPTFKSNERMFQLLVQTAGRAGRSDKKGKVLLQTNMVTDIIEYAIKNDYTKFYNYEIKRREVLQYPPFSNISFITIKGTEESKAFSAAKAIYNFLYKHYDSEKILGPSKSLLYKVNNEYKYNISVRFNDESYSKLHKILKYIHNYFSDVYNKDKISITIDNSASDYI